MRVDLIMCNLNEIVGHRYSWILHLLRVKYPRVFKLVYDTVEPAEQTWVDQEKDGDTNTHEDGTSLT